MENDPKKVLISQVRDYLVEFKLWEADKYQVYQHFVAQCNQFGITEEEFYKEILRTAHASINFEELIDDPDPRNEKNTSVQIFGEKIHSLKRLGQVLFDHPDRLDEYFEDASLLKTHVDTLTTGDHALEYAKLFKEETAPEKRWLRVIYHLNPRLPYRIGQSSFTDLKSMFKEAFNDKYLYNQIYNEFVSGKLMMWLKECNPVEFDKIPEGRSYNAYLNFIYGVDEAYPFYLEDHLFASPYDLVLRAQKDIAFRILLYEYINNGRLFEWFDSIKQADWKIRYQSEVTKLIQEGLKGEVLAYAAVEKLIRIIDHAIAAPQLTADVTKLQFLNIEAGKPVYAAIVLKLTNQGFVKAEISLDQLLEGVKIDQTEVAFFDLAGQTENTVTLAINPVLLMKDKLYQLELSIVTDYQKLIIPVAIKTIFPMRTFVVYLAKYGLVGFIFLGFIRFLLGVFIERKTWLEPDLVTSDFNATLPGNYLAFIFVLLLLLAGSFFGFKLIKKAEKI